MPSFSCSSVIRAASENHILSLKVTHNLVHGSPTKHVHKFRGRLSKELDVLWLSDIIIVFTGFLDEREASASKILQSGLLSQIQKHLRVNASQLGLNNISSSYIDEEDGRTKLILTPSRSLPCTLRPHVVLTSLETSFLWKTTNCCKRPDSPCDVLTVDGGPLSPKVYLPTETLLGRVMEQFLTHHLIGRYPLIFGPWSMGLDLETKYFAPISRSIFDILSRSKNPHFRSKYSRLLKIARHRLDSVFQTSSAALASHFEESASEEAPSGDDDKASTARLSDEGVLCQVLEQLYRIGVPQRRPKLAAHWMNLLSEEDDDDLVDLPKKDFNDVALSSAADVSVAMVHASYICDQHSPKLSGVNCYDFTAKYLPEHGDNTPSSIYPEHTYENTSLARGIDFATPPSSSPLGRVFDVSSRQDYLHSVATSCLQTPPSSTDHEYRHACSDLVTSLHTGVSHGSGRALQDNCLFEVSLDPWSANSADDDDDPRHNFAPLILDDGPSLHRGPSEDFEIWSTSPLDVPEKIVEEDMDLVLFDSDDGSAESSEVDLFVDSTASSFSSPPHDLYMEDIMFC